MSNGLPPDIDDTTISDSEWLYIRVFPDKDSLIFDQNLNAFRPTTSALKSREQPLSVDLGSLCPPQETRDRDKSFAFHVAAFTAETVRRYGCRIVRDPIQESQNEPENLAHALVFGNHDSGSGGLIPKSQSRKIARESRIVLLNETAL
jgi:hypothetical protein